MPSPFPGMDPYLEDPELWRGVHARLIFCASDALNSTLPSGFIADIDARVYMEEPARGVYPDLSVKRRRDMEVRERAAGDTALMPAVGEDVPEELTILAEEIEEGFIKIRTGPRWQRIVTLIEFLSPTNKTPGNPGRRSYYDKQAELLESETHLLEIDLLRKGAHTVAAPLQGASRARKVGLRRLPP